MLNLHVAGLYELEMIVGVSQIVGARKSADQPKPGPTTTPEIN